jgi:transcriptional regulator with PAS, ATPase and Fis domain
VEVNVRIVAATNRPLEEMIKKGEFREDLFYRLNVLPIQLPPLRERKNDITHLAEYFIDKFNAQYSKNISGFSPEAMEMLMNHAWPGNIRELENVIEHSFVIETQSQLTPASLPESLTGKSLTRSAGVRPGLTTALSDDSEDLSDIDLDDDSSEELVTGEVLATGTAGTPNFQLDSKGFTLDINRLDFQANKEEFERRFLISALKAFKGRINQTALHANIPKKTLLRKLQKYGINARDYV